MERYKNKLILASAGTGKTFALVTRMIRFLLQGVLPQEIVALTFSRAAAGEIFGRVVERLSKAAISSEGARKEIEILEKEGPLPFPSDAVNEMQCRFSALLFKVIATQHLSMTGTLDHFLMKIVQLFPLEIGLQGAVAVMDDFQLQQARLQISEEIFGKRDNASAFLRAFSAANQGESLRAYAEKFGSMIQKWHRVIQDFPNDSSWAPVNVIWPSSPPVTPTEEERSDLLQAMKTLGERVAHGNKGWDQLMDDLRTYTGREKLTTPSNNLIQSASACRGGFSVTINRKPISFAGSDAQLMRSVASFFSHTLCALHVGKIQGIYQLMKEYETRYANEIRMRGRLSFDDLSRLITRLDDVKRLGLEYRFDARLRHWELDEFQDTSTEQWGVIKNLVEEVLQDPEDRSVLIVGDNKQAIYGWRNGDVRIIEDLFTQFSSQDQSQNTVEYFSHSRRYRPQISAAVNRVFCSENLDSCYGGKKELAATLDRWNSRWKNHTSHDEKDGFVRFQTIPVPDADEPLSTFVQAIVAELNVVRPWERGFTCAILLRSNSDGEELANQLRLKGIPAVWEGESAVSDSPLVLAFVHLLRLAEYPDDTFSEAFLKSTPFRDLFWKPGVQTCDISSLLAESFAKLGLARAFQSIAENLPDTVWDDFSRGRFTDLLKVAVAFESNADAKRPLSLFSDFLDQQKRRDFADSSSVKVMTIHRSKGLGFDLVILPLLSAKKGANGVCAKEVDLVDPQGSWFFGFSPKDVWQTSPSLKNAHDIAIGDSFYESLCIQYVAMTRAKIALTILAREDACAQNPRNSPRATDCIVCAELKTQGDAEWYLHTGPESSAKKADREVDRVLLPRSPRKRIQRVVPSQEREASYSASLLFEQAGARQLGMLRGTKIHALLQQIEWLPNERYVSLLRDEGVDLMSDSSFRRALQRDDKVVDLWIERSFEMLEEGVWISGTMDRVVFRKDATNQLSVEIFDFKTNQCFQDESASVFECRMRKTYEQQMRLYRQAVCRLTHLPVERIAMKLLLTETLSVVELFG